MLKRLALRYWPLAVLVVLVATIFCMSRYAENRKAKHQDNAQGSSPNTVISPNGNSQGAQNTNEPHKYPNWIDTFAWPEGATAWALFLTLLVIAWQSVETRAAVDAANSQIQFMKDKERARLEIEIDKFDYVPTAKPFFLQKVSWRVRLHGQSEATILKKHIIACIGEPNEHPMFNFGVYEMAIRNVMTPSERIAYGSTPISPTSTTVDDVGAFDLDSLKEKKGILYCAGYITFKDVFGDVWTLPFKRKWAYERFGSDELDSEGWGGEWQQEGDNEER